MSAEGPTICGMGKTVHVQILNFSRKAATEINTY